MGHHPIPTRSSRPKSHPKQLNEKLVEKIVDTRIRLKRSSEVIHKTLENEGINVSLASVKRTLDRKRLLNKRSPWKRYHPPVDRPYPLKAGDLVEMDTIHLMIDKKKRIYVYTLIDVYSRYVYAYASEHIGANMSVSFVKRASKKSSFEFNMLQSDHGPEFGARFVSLVKKKHRYTRVGKPNDNAHIERFNRTLQEEFLDFLPRNVNIINYHLHKYLDYYNNQRLHFGIQLKTPKEMLGCSQGID